jgi:hypothetical protein
MPYILRGGTGNIAVCFFFLIATAFTDKAWGTDLPSGTFKFEKSQTYRYPKTPVDPPPFPTIQIRGNKATFSMSCTATFTPQDYFFSDVFQPMSKSGDTQAQLDRFLTREFNLSLAKTKTVLYVPAPARSCADPVMYMFVTANRVIIPVGETFYSYVSATAVSDSARSGAVSQSAQELVAPYKVTALPMDFDRYLSKCVPKILGGRRLPQTTDKCAPDYYPYVADPKKGDALMNIVGNHDYAKGGSSYADLFSPPFKMKTAATFLVYPPVKQVVLVRVDDLEAVQNEQRDIMSGVYLSIVDGKVVDQMGGGCSFNREYVCVSDGQVMGRLTPSGRIQRTKGE